MLKQFYDGKRTEQLHPELPPGTVKYGEKHVTSAVIQGGGRSETCYIRGRFDVVVEFDDHTYGVIDFKTGNPTEEKHSLYGRQLMAYAYALENPASGSLSLAPVTVLGLLYFYPSRISQQSVDWLSYDANRHWVPVPKNDQEFLALIGDVLEVLRAPVPPDSSSNCDWCQYAEKVRGIVG